LPISCWCRTWARSAASARLPIRGTRWRSRRLPTPCTNGPRAPDCAARNSSWRKTTAPEGTTAARGRKGGGEMGKTLVLVLLALCTGGLAAAPVLAGDPPPGGLRAQWIGLTRDVAWPATWQDAGRFHYRKTDEGGFAFFGYELDGGRKAPAFDHVAIARALAAAGGGE